MVTIPLFRQCLRFCRLFSVQGEVYPEEQQEKNYIPGQSPAGIPIDNPTELMTVLDDRDAQSVQCGLDQRGF